MASIASPTLPANTSFCIPESKRMESYWHTGPASKSGQRSCLTYAMQLPPATFTRAREDWGPRSVCYGGGKAHENEGESVRSSETARVEGSAKRSSCAGVLWDCGPSAAELCSNGKAGQESQWGARRLLGK